MGEVRGLYNVSNRIYSQISMHKFVSPDKYPVLAESRRKCEKAFEASAGEK